MGKRKGEKITFSVDAEIRLWNIFMQITYACGGYNFLSLFYDIVVVTENWPLNNDTRRSLPPNKSRKKRKYESRQITFRDITSYNSCHSIPLLSNSTIHVEFIFAIDTRKYVHNFILCYFWDFNTKLSRYFVIGIFSLYYSFCGGRDLAQCCCLNIYCT